MPRLKPALIHQVGRTSPHLAALLPTCRTRESAQTELRWIREHVLQHHPANPSRIAHLVARRAAGIPLQYVLGTQPFAGLEILCHRGVLIPRPETEAWASLLADLLFSSPATNLRVLDLCSGTGCIGLSLFARGKGTRVFGFDISARAVRLARRNLVHNFRSSHPEDDGAVTFRTADIFRDEWMACLDGVDVLVSNPPYISPRGFAVQTGRSVRNHEPKIALVPLDGAYAASCALEDVFYARLLDVADALRPRFAVLEVGDMAQAVRVLEMVLARGDARTWEVMEVWRDWPDCLPSEGEDDTVLVSGREVPVRGSGHGRVVFLAESGMIRNRFTNKGFRRKFYMD